MSRTTRRAEHSALTGAAGRRRLHASTEEVREVHDGCEAAPEMPERLLSVERRTVLGEPEWFTDERGRLRFERREVVEVVERRQRVACDIDLPGGRCLRMPGKRSHHCHFGAGDKALFWHAPARSVQRTENLALAHEFNTHGVVETDDAFIPATAHHVWGGGYID